MFINKYHYFLLCFTTILIVCLFSSILLSCNKNQSTKTQNVQVAQSQKYFQSKEQSGVYYSLFVRSFADSNADGIGDLKGLIQKLNYLNDGNPKTKNDLGVTGIWLLPIFPSHSYHGYDVDDYYSINSDYGTMKDFEKLISECKKRGIAVILDIPFNHSSVYNKWFVSSKSIKSPYRAWYRWTDGHDVNLNASIWDHKIWNKDQNTNTYYSGLFFKGMPDFNCDSKEVRDEFKQILEFWLLKGVDGFRFDAASHIYNAAKLPIGDKTGQERALDFWQEITTFVKEKNSNAFMVAEVWDSAGVRANYMKALPSTFHFDLGEKIINAVKNEDSQNNSIAHYLYNDLCSYKKNNDSYIDSPFITNHDQNRFALQFKNDKDKIKLAASMYIFSEGVPFVYYGEEIGMNGAKPDEQIRTPFIWRENKKDKNQTFWIESKYNAKTIPFATQQKDKNSILNYYKKIIKLKTQNLVLRYGRLEPYDTKNSKITSWILRYKKENTHNATTDKKCLVLFNLSCETQIVNIASSGFKKIIFSTNKGVKLKNNLVTLPPCATVVLQD